MNSNPRRVAAIGLALLLIVGVGYGIISSASSALGPGTVALHGLIGSETGPFFADARVTKALKGGGFDVAVTTAGSRQIKRLEAHYSGQGLPTPQPSSD